MVLWDNNEESHQAEHHPITKIEAVCGLKGVSSVHSHLQHAKQNCWAALYHLSTSQHFLTVPSRNKTPSISRNCVHASVFTLEGHTSIYGKMADSALVICSTLTMPQTFSREDNCQWSELMFRASAETVEGWWNSSFSPFLSSLTQPGDEHFALL